MNLYLVLWRMFVTKVSWWGETSSCGLGKSNVDVVLFLTLLSEKNIFLVFSFLRKKIGHKNKFYRKEFSALSKHITHRLGGVYALHIHRVKVFLPSTLMEVQFSRPCHTYHYFQISFHMILDFSKLSRHCFLSLQFWYQKWRNLCFYLTTSVLLMFSFMPKPSKWF